jgi:putative DNA methylase
VKTERVDVTYADGTTRTVLRPLFEVFEPKKVEDVEQGTVKLGSATCPVSGFTTPVASIRIQIAKRNGGSTDSRLLCVVTTRHGRQGRVYRLPTTKDCQLISLASDELFRQQAAHTGDLSLVPDEPTPLDGTGSLGGGYRTRKYGITSFGQLFNARQTLTLVTLVRNVRRCALEIASNYEAGLANAISACLTFAVGRIVDQSTTFVAWANTIEAVTHTFGRQALSMMWDHVEPNPFGNAGGDFGGAIEWVVRVCSLEAKSHSKPGTVSIASATNHSLPDDSASALITDPPYYDAVPYADLADFFYVWIKRGLHDIFPDLMKAELTPKKEECIVDLQKQKDRNSFEQMMRRCMSEGRRILGPSGVGLIVFAHKTTEGWEAQLQAMFDAGWIITGSWPIDTERPVRLRAIGSAALASSVHLVCRPREQPDGSLRMDEVGDWRDVLQELPRRIHEWMPRLAEEGVVGADAIFACLGPALEIFSRYSRVEKASGETVTLKEYLESVWAAVAKEALTIIFPDADTAGFEEDARLTAMWLWTLNAGNNNGDGAEKEEANDESEDDTKKAKVTGFVLEYDAARKIAQGLGAHLEDLSSLVEVSGETARLLPVGERARTLFGKEEGKVPPQRKKREPQMNLFKVLEEVDDSGTTFGETKVACLGETVLDRIHQSMILFAAGRGEALKRLLVEDGVGQDQRFWRLAQALSALYPSHTEEKRWVDGVLARKKGLGF